MRALSSAPAHPGPSPQPSPRSGAGALGWGVLALALLSLFALAWILWRRATGSLWLDDAYSISVASRTPAGILEALRTDSWPPLYFLALHGWMKVAGSGEWAVRGLSLGAYLLAVLFTGLAGAEATRSRAGGWTAALVAALSPVALQGSTAVRGYALLELWCALTLLLFLRAFAPDRRTGWLGLAALVVAGALGTFTHYWALFALGGLGVAGLVVLPRAVWPRLVASLALAVAPFLLWTPTVLLQIRQGGQTSWMRRPGIPDLIGSIWTPVGGPIAVLGIVAALVLCVKHCGCVGRCSGPPGSSPWRGCSRSRRGCRAWRRSPSPRGGRRTPSGTAWRRCPRWRCWRRWRCGWRGRTGR